MEMSERERRGREILRTMLPQGSPPVQSSEVLEFANKLAAEFCFAGIWDRPQLAFRERSLVTLGAMVAQMQSEYVATHVRIAVSNGLSYDEIREAVLQTLPYVGFPAAMAALRRAEAVFAELAADSMSTDDDR